MACSLLVNDASALCFQQQKRAYRVTTFIAFEELCLSLARGERTHDASLKKPDTPLVIPSTVNIHVAVVRTMSRRVRFLTISNSLCEKASKVDCVSTRVS